MLSEQTLLFLLSLWECFKGPQCPRAVFCFCTIKFGHVRNALDPRLKSRPGRRAVREHDLLQDIKLHFQHRIKQNLFSSSFRLNFRAVSKGLRRKNKFDKPNSTSASEGWSGDGVEEGRWPEALRRLWGSGWLWKDRKTHTTEEIAEEKPGGGKLLGCCLQAFLCLASLVQASFLSTPRGSAWASGLLPSLWPLPSSPPPSHPHPSGHLWEFNLNQAVLPYSVAETNPKKIKAERWVRFVLCWKITHNNHVLLWLTLPSSGQLYKNPWI